MLTDLVIFFVGGGRGGGSEYFQKSYYRAPLNFYICGGSV